MNHHVGKGKNELVSNTTSISPRGSGRQGLGWVGGKGKDELVSDTNWLLRGAGQATGGTTAILAQGTRCD